MRGSDLRSPLFPGRVDRTPRPAEPEQAPCVPGTRAGTPRATAAESGLFGVAAGGERDRPGVGGPSGTDISRGDTARTEGAVAAPSAGASRHPSPDLLAVRDSVIDGMRVLVAHQAAMTEREETLAARQAAVDERENLLAAQRVELLERAELPAARETAMAQREVDLAATTAELDATRNRVGELVLREREHCKMLEEI